MKLVNGNLNLNSIRRPKGEDLMLCNDSMVQWEEKTLPLLTWQALTQ